MKQLLLASAALVIATSAHATTYQVGPTRALQKPSAAASVVHDGDVVQIDPGDYNDCAVWQANNLTVIGMGARAQDTVIHTATCWQKGLFVVEGNNVSVRRLTLSNATDGDGNGAGIRADGPNLSVLNVTFSGNQDGILINDNAGSVVQVIGSNFLGNGYCGATGENCAHGIYAGHIAELVVTNSTFSDTLIGHHVKSRANRTEVLSSHITDGPSGTASFLVDLPNGGALVLDNNVMEKGPNASNHNAAVSIGEEGYSNPAGEMVIANNVFTNDMSQQTAFVVNSGPAPANLSSNRLGANTVPLMGPGTVN